jgi:hypothetical protein
MFLILGTCVTLALASVWISARVQGYLRMIFATLILLALCGIVACCTLLLVGVGVP